MTSFSPIHPPTDEVIARAASMLRAGGLVAFPTETVYGLGGDATQAQAVAAIYEAKGRPQFNPLIVHVADAADAAALVMWDARAEKLARAFWPGPLTLVLPRAENSPVALLASAGLDSIAVRCPQHDVARALIRAAGVPVAAPSANASGKLSPTRAAHVQESLGGRVDLILDGGACAVGLESTVLDLCGAVPTILRHGGVTKERLLLLLGDVRESVHDESAPRSPGMMLSHYAPERPVRLNVRQAGEDEAFLLFGEEAGFSGGAERLNLSPRGDLLEAAAHLFDMLRRLDQGRFSAIAVAPIPMEGLGAAMNDRLQRAAQERQ